MSCRALLQVIFPNQGSNQHLLCLWHYTATLSLNEESLVEKVGCLSVSWGNVGGRGEIMDENIVYLGIGSSKRMCILFLLGGVVSINVD